MPRYQILDNPRNVTVTLDEESFAYLLAMARSEGSNISAATRRVIGEHRSFFSSRLHQSEEFTKAEVVDPADITA
jgi:hypothetical protein